MENYSICKDKKIEATIDILERLFKKCGIEFDVRQYKYDETTASSYHLDIKGTTIGTNGKGMTDRNALASAYAEFMERLQNQFLGFSFISDFYTIPNDYEFLKNNVFIKEELDNPNSLSLLYQINNEWKKFYDKPQKIAIQNYYSVRTGKEVGLPIDFVHHAQGSNGMAAGNTIEEALVQGLSEISERYTTKLILKTHKKIPTIPRKYIEKYQNIISLVNFIESNGYEITFKDASCGKFPVIIAIFEDLKYKQNGLIIKPGAHPYFPVAIERTLTEFLQGYNIKNDNMRKIIQTIKLDNNADYDDICLNLFMQKIPVDVRDKNFTNFFSTDFDYKFNPDVWYHNEVSNKEMAKSLCTKFLDCAKDIYIRNCDFLGFPTISICIPGISNVRFLSDKNLRELLNIHQIRNYLKEEKYDKLSIENLFKACEFNSKPVSKIPGEQISNIEPEVIACYCAVLKNDVSKIQKYLNKIILLFDNYTPGNNSKSSNITFYKALSDYFNLSLSGHSTKNIQQKLKEKFDETTTKQVFVFLYALNFDRIIKIIKNNNNESDNPHLEIIKQKLKQIYLDNIPQQNVFSKIFD